MGEAHPCNGVIVTPACLSNTFMWLLSAARADLGMVQIGDPCWSGPLLGPNLASCAREYYTVIGLAGSSQPS
jgi:hypothetical protein